MNFEKTGLSAIVVAATIVGGVIASSPAYAISVGSKIEFGWAGVLTPTNADFKPIFAGSPDAGFGQFLIGVGEGDFSSFDPSVSFFPYAGNIRDLTSTLLDENNSSDDIESFITFGTNAFKLTSINYFVNPGDARGYHFKGIFQDGSAGIGSITTQIDTVLTKNVYYSGNLIVPAIVPNSDDAQSVPTPALLPGLIGMGIAAIRKRKSQATESLDV